MAYVFPFCKTYHPFITYNFKNCCYLLFVFFTCDKKLTYSFLIYCNITLVLLGIVQIRIQPVNMISDTLLLPLLSWPTLRQLRWALILLNPDALRQHTSCQKLLQSVPLLLKYSCTEPPPKPPGPPKFRSCQRQSQRSCLSQSWYLSWRSRNVWRSR